MIDLKYFSYALIAGMLLILPHNPAAADNSKCTLDKACELNDRGYHVLPPDGWDGKSSLPVLLYFHGWGRQGPVPINHKHIGGATRKHNVLLIAPNGLRKSWAFWQPGSRDTQFALDVLSDVEKHYPIDRSRLMVAGYSWGSSMAWRFSCEAGDRVSILFGISGTLYDQNEKCESGPVEVRHVHGLKDTVMDYPHGEGFDETGPIHLWRRTNRCLNAPDQSKTWRTSQKFRRLEWTSCLSGKSVTLDIHKGGHWIARGWLDEQLKQINSARGPS